MTIRMSWPISSGEIARSSGDGRRGRWERQTRHVAPAHPSLHPRPTPHRAKLLRPHEAEALAPLASKAQVVWAWQTHFWTRALGGDLGTTPVPHAAMLAPLVMKRCVDHPQPSPLP